MLIEVSNLQNLEGTIGNAAMYGNNAAQITWQNALSIGCNLLDTEEKQEALRAQLKASGMDNTEALNSHELNALLVQLVAGELWERGYTELNEVDNPEELDGYLSMDYVDGKTSFFYYIGF